MIVKNKIVMQVDNDQKQKELGMFEFTVFQVNDDKIREMNAYEDLK